MSLDQKTLGALRSIVGEPGVLTSTAALETYSYDATTDCRGVPDVVVFPSSTGEVSEVMQLAGAMGVPVTVRGAGTCLSGGSIPVRGGIVLCMTRMNRIISINAEDFSVSAEAGVVLQNMNLELAKQNLFFPPDPQSFAAATIGGCLAVGSGGPFAVKYGLFKHYILGMTVVLASGAIVTLGGNTMKNVVGYDLPQLLCGSEGTLGIITEATFRLLSLPPAKETILAVFDSVLTAGQAVHRIRSGSVLPAKIEMMDNWLIRRIEANMPMGLPLSADAILLFELHGVPETAEQEAREVMRLCRETGATEVRLAQDDREAASFWAARRAAFSAIYGSAPTILMEDITVPTSRIPALIAFLKNLQQESGFEIVLVGHAGDGNLHPCILTDRNDTAHFRRAKEAVQKIYSKALELGGAISGEHGIGLEKQPYLSQALSAEVIQLMKEIKQAFDPRGILNPGKIWEHQ